jgi:YfiH family protein
MSLEILKPRIFEKYSLVVGFVTKNLDLNKSLSKGLDFKLTHQKEFDESLETVSRELCFAKEKFIFNNQKHTNSVRVVDSNSEQNLDFDGSVTKEKGLIVTAKSADCSIVLFYDFENDIVGCVHSGLAGTANEISQNCIKKMLEQGLNPKTTLAYICPTISQKNYPTGKSNTKLIPERFKISEHTPEGKQLLAELKYNLSTHDEELYFVDIKGMIKQQLMDLGLLESNIETSDICTYEDPNLHSYRRDRTENGLSLGYIGMIENKY